jgi:hypothetical protein
MYSISKIICILSWLVFYCAYCYFNDMFCIHFIRSLEYWINEWICDNRQNVFQLSFQTERGGSRSYFQIFPYRIPRSPLLETIILWNYTITIIICLTNYNAVINRNYGRLWDLILFFKHSMGTRKKFLEIYRQFGNAPAKRFASPALGAPAP